VVPVRYFAKYIAIATGVARNFDGGRWANLKKICDIILVACFVDVITIFLKFDFVIVSLKIHNLAKSRNFMSPILKELRGAGDGEPLALGNF